MKIVERSFRGKFKRPKTLVHLNEEINLGIVATIWGDEQIFNRIKTEVEDYFSAAISDVEVTTPFGYIESLTPLSNYLRIALLLLNDSIYRSENRNEYTLGCEVLVFAQKNHEFSFASIGHPEVYLKKQNIVNTLRTTMGLNTELMQDHCYLPKEFLGVEKSCYPQLGSFKIEKQDELYLLSGMGLEDKSFLSNPGFSVQTGIEYINSIQNKNHLHSFWLAAVGFD